MLDDRFISPDPALSPDALSLYRRIEEARLDLERSKAENMELIEAVLSVCDSLDALIQRLSAPHRLSLAT